MAVIARSCWSPCWTRVCALSSARSETVWSATGAAGCAAWLRSPQAVGYAIRRAVRIDKGQEKIDQLHYGAEPFRLAGRDEPLWLVVLAGFGEQPILLVTNLKLRARNSETLWWAARIYWTRWKMEETFRFVKQSYNLEDLRAMK